MLDFYVLNNSVCAEYLNALMSLPLNQKIGGLPLKHALILLKQYLGQSYCGDALYSEWENFTRWIVDQGYPVAYHQEMGVTVILPKNHSPIKYQVIIKAEGVSFVYSDPVDVRDMLRNYSEEEYKLKVIAA